MDAGIIKVNCLSVSVKPFRFCVTLGLQTHKEGQRSRKGCPQSFPTFNLNGVTVKIRNGGRKRPMGKLSELIREIYNSMEEMEPKPVVVQAS